MIQKKSTVITYNNKNYRITGYSEKDHIFQQIIKSRSFYDIKTLEKIKSLNLSGTYIDIGANIGNHSIFFLNECNLETLVAIEANNQLIPLLNRNINKNNYYDKFYMVLNYLIATYEVAYFYIADEGNNIGMSFSSPHKNKDGHIEQRKGISLDNALLGINGLKKISLLKIDVEGQELDVLKSSEKILLKHHPFICLEIFPENFYQVSNYLEKRGYCYLDKYNHNYFYGYRYSFQLIFMKCKKEILKFAKIFFSLSTKINGILN